MYRGGKKAPYGNHIYFLFRSVVLQNGDAFALTVMLLYPQQGLEVKSDQSNLLPKKQSEMQVSKTQQTF